MLRPTNSMRRSMAENPLTDKAEREFAGDDRFMIQEAGGPERERRNIVLKSILAGNPWDRPDDLAHLSNTEDPRTLDEVLAVRRAVARKQG
jgi:hypothetical protein